MCNYHLSGTQFECRGDGFLWNADFDGWDPSDHTHPCPACNTRQFLTDAKEIAQSCSYMLLNGSSDTGESFWLNAVRIAETANNDQASEVLRTFRAVSTLKPAAGGRTAGEVETVSYVYS